MTQGIRELNREDGKLGERMESEYSVGSMASMGLRSDVPINQDERLMRVMNFAYL